MDTSEKFGYRLYMAPDSPAPGPALSPSPAPVTSPAPSPAPAPAEPEKKAMTQAEIDALVAGAKKEGGEKLWKKHGFDNEKAFEDFLAAAKVEADAKKTEAQKDKEAKDVAEKKANEAAARADKAEARAEAFLQGVSKDKVDDIVALAMNEEGATMADKIKAAIEKRPWAKETVVAQQVPSQNAKIHSQFTPSMQAADAQLDAVFGPHGEKK